MYILKMNYSNGVQKFSKKLGYFKTLESANRYLESLSEKQNIEAFVTVTLSEELLGALQKRGVPGKVLNKFKMQKDDDALSVTFEAVLGISEFEKLRKELPGKKSVDGWFLNVENNVKKTISKNGLSHLNKKLAKKLASNLFKAVDRHAINVTFALEQLEFVDA